jgi:hypothetical protein
VVATTVRVNVAVEVDVVIVEVTVELGVVMVTVGPTTCVEVGTVVKSM